ncbi:DNA double-strand break repair protein Rad50 [Candidatus Phytoplasma ziziphi]|uniref:DNA double-strand break repair protein Rad50 n=1 Tax=Ziziphus jujuba witches'-broom phytoplasma TaxID=135727 RepID=UPI001EDFFC0A|nr:DNA double-strand break repair protein Rad50 [Candidatus Phytoplasma ziziphi]
MLTPLNLIKGFINFRAYYTWAITAISIFSIFFFFKRKYDNTHNNYSTTWKGYLVYFLIILFLFSFIYLSFFKTPPSSKYVGQLIGEIDKAIDKYDETINNYKGLKKDWETELKKCEDELKTLYEKQEITQEQKEKIKKILEQNEGKIKEIKDQLKDTTDNIAILKGQLLQLEQDKETKEKEIKQKQEEEKLASPDDKIRLQAQISKLQSEKSKIIGEIEKIEFQIGKLENKQSSLTEQLELAETFKKGLKEKLNNLSEKFKELSTIITTWEDRKAEIQTNINEVNQKLEEIGTERDLYGILKNKYQDMHNRLITYEKENALTFGTATKAAFKAFDKITDLFPAKFAIKTLGKTISVTRKFAQGAVKSAVVLHEGHRLWHMYNDVINENKEHPLMITKETLEMYTKDIDRDLARLNADYKDCEKKKEEYNKINNEASCKEQIKNWQHQNDKQSSVIEQEWKDWIKEYVKINEELVDKLKEVSGTRGLYNDKDNLEQQLEDKNVEIETAKAVLKEKNPSYARAQARFEEKQKAKRQTKIPELVIIPNK